MAKKRIFILGAGLAGLSAAWHLQKKGIDCQVFEKESEVGGLCRSRRINGFIFDYCGHLLHFKHRYTFNLVKNLLGDNLVEHKRNARIYSHRRYTRYPFQANLYGLPSSVAKECLLGFIDASKNGRNQCKKELNFLDWINNTFGKGIARHFMIPYNTKFWTLSPKKLTCEWLDGFVPVPSLNQVIDGTVEESHRQMGYNARFWYPKRGGISQLPSALAAQIKNIHTNCRISEINLAKKEVKLFLGDKEKFDYLISTIPLPEVPKLIKGLPPEAAVAFKKLKWNSIFNLNLGIKGKVLNGQHWIYFPEEKFCFFRVGFPHNFSPYAVSPDTNSLYIEVAYSKDKPIHKSDVILDIKNDLAKAGILNQGNIISDQDVNDIKYGYPIYDINYRRARETVIKFLMQNNIIPCGRYGSWRYLSMEDVVLDGRKTVRQIKC